MIRVRRILSVLLALAAGAGLVWTVFDRRINGNTPWLVLAGAAVAAVIGYLVTPRDERKPLRRLFD